MNSPSKSSTSHEASPLPARLLLKTGSDERTICFYPSLFQLIIESNGVAERVDLGYAGSRLLERLLRDPGEVVPREDLMGFAWPDRVVGQGSLNQQIYSLRQIFCDEKGRDIIQTLPRRGYQFNPNYVIGREYDALPAAEPAPGAGLSNEPAPIEQASTEALALPKTEADESTPRPDPASEPQPEPEPAVVPPPMAHPYPADESDRGSAQTESKSASQPMTNTASIWPAAALFVVALLIGLGISASIESKHPDLLTRDLEAGHVTLTLMAADAATLDAVERDTEALLQRIATLSQKPADLALDWHDGYLKLFCQRSAGDTSWLMFHQSQLDQLADEQLVQCLS